MDDLISIIVPVYNSEKYLSECIDSILNQTHKNLQVILVDDCSTDSSPKICADYAKRDKRVEVYRTEVNSGQSASRNLGLSHVKGEWVTFADNDDTLDPKMHETLLANSKKYNVLVSGCANKRIENSNVKICNLNNAKSGVYNTYPIIKDILINPCDTWVEVWSKIYHKSLINKLNFPEGCQLEDYMVVLPILYEVKEVYFDNRPFYNWFIRSTSQSSKKFFENRLSYFEITEKLRSYFVSNDAPNGIIDAVYVWELGVKAKLLEDMCKSGNEKFIKFAKSKMNSVSKLIYYANKCSDYKLKSRIHVRLRLLRVKLS